MIDVLIIGSGGAGLSAALSAKESGAKVLVVSKTYPTHSQTVQAQGGINAVIEEGENDTISNHITDTYNSSKELALKKNIEFICNNAKNTITWLDKIGVPFSRDENGKIAQRPFGGTKSIRTCYSSDYTGLKIVHTLYDNCIKNDIEFLNEHILIDLITNDNTVYGAIFINIINSELVKIYSKTTVIATGGYSNIYNGFTTNSISTTGDGISIAYKNGAYLSNMEFVQFHPTALKGSNTLISESARAEGAFLVTKDGKRFVDELSTRDVVARAIKDKILLSEEVFLDLRHININSLKEKMSQEIKLIKDLLNLNVQNDLIPINPAAHYTMGGILTNVSCETSMENLYAVGECAQNNIHGANRLGGNSLLEIITMGLNCGKKSAEKANKIENKIIETNQNFDIETILNKNGKNCIYKIKDELAEILFKKVGLYREEEELKSTLLAIEELEAKYKDSFIEDKNKVYNRNLIDFIELEHLLKIAKLVTISALKRDESRGAHFRKDYPKQNDKLNKISIVKLNNEIIQHEFKELK